ncbi:MAG TPA: hypothetical protein PLP88_03225 [Bacteroidales bacterium]|nr:hypothetical protein [Bacteroidales bacterium]
MKSLLFTVLIITIAANGLHAQSETDWLPDQPGKWSFHHKIHGDIEKYKLTSNELTALQQKIDTITETFHRNPVLKNPVGFDPSLNVMVLSDDKVGFKTISMANAIIEYRIAIQFCPLFRDESGNVKKHCTEVTSCDIHVNQPKATSEKYLHYSASELHPAPEKLEIAAQNLSKIFIKPLVTKELAAGVTAYQSGIIIVSDPKRTYWIPVKSGELFDQIIEYYKIVQEKDNSYSYVIEAIEKEKGAFTTEQLNGPAYFTTGNISGVTAVENNSPLVRFNPDYFDKSLPRTSIQLIAVHTLTEAFYDNYECPSKHTAELRHCEFVKQIDGNALKALLDVK